jgi:diguanylate cyclase (GGDEF)-like protein
VAWSLWHSGSIEAAVEVANRLALVCSASSGARSFPLWVRAQVLAAAQPSAAVRAQQDHAAMLSRLRWESRQAVLVAAQAQIAAARRQAEHEGLSRAVRTDPLTGLDNRRTFDAWLDRGDSTPLPPTALLLVDLDDFKAVNDNYGHDYGDEVLRRLGRLLLESVRPGDLAVRLGGDEFAVLLSGESLTANAARTRARELHAAITSEAWGEVSRGLVVSASIGLAVSDRSRGGPRTAALYRAADAALYAAKGTGGDAVVVADDLDTGGLAGVGLTRPARRSALG